MSGLNIVNPVYRIETKRLVLRCWEPKDAPLMQKAIAESREHLIPFMEWAADEPQTVEQKVQLIRRFRGRFDRNEDFVYGIFPRDETRVLGGTGLHTRLSGNALEIGYWLHKDFINQGLITEATAALTKVAFELHHVERMEIHCSAKNPASAAVPRKLGYVHEATRRRLGFAHGNPTDSMIWTLFADEYPSTPCAAAEIKAFDIIGNPML
ncbi:MAG: GNAT family N-acetyltransferase [Chloroflexi bacterium]|nr:GNAT family N-acetyltransferase [Chloroflexota bacterium]